MAQPSELERPSCPPLVLIAIDAGDRELIEGWVDEGRLPTLARLRASGCHGRLVGPRSMHCEHRELAHHLQRRLAERSRLLLLPPARAPGSLPARGKLLAAGGRRRGRSGPGLRGERRARRRPRRARGAARRRGSRASSSRTGRSHQPDMAALSAGRASRRGRSPRRGRCSGRTRTSRSSRREAASARIARSSRGSWSASGGAARSTGTSYAASDFDLVVLGFYEGREGSHRFWAYRAESQGGVFARADAALSRAVRDLYEATDRELGAILDALPDDCERRRPLAVRDEGRVPHHRSAGFVPSSARSATRAPGAAPRAVTALSFDRPAHMRAEERSLAAPPRSR